MRTSILVSVLWCFIIMLCSAQYAGACGGGGGNDGASSSSSSSSINSPMSSVVIGTFFGIPITMVPYQGPQQPPKSNIPTIGPMSQETREQIMVEDLNTALDRSEATAQTLAMWQNIRTVAWVVELAGTGSRVTLSFVPGVGWVVNASLSALNGAVGSYQQGGSTGDIAANATFSGATSGLINGFNLGAEFANNQLSQAAINFMAEAATGEAANQIGNVRDRSTVPPTNRPWGQMTAPEGLLNQQYAQ